MEALRPSCSRALYARSPPVGIPFDETPNRYLATANRIRKANATQRNISPIAGTGEASFSREAILATNATLDSPQGLAVDSAGAIYFVDQRNFHVRKLTPSRLVADAVTNYATLKIGPVAPSSPGLFAITDQDGCVNSASSPPAPASVLILYGTGEGQTVPAGVDGSVSTSLSSLSRFKSAPAQPAYSTPVLPQSSWRACCKSTSPFQPTSAALSPSR